MPSVKEVVGKLSTSFFCSEKDSCPLLQQALAERRELKAENEKLREIFEFATGEFEKRNRKIAFLEEELKKRDTTIKEKRYENELLKRRLQQLEARNNLLNKMVFGRKSEKKENEEPDVTISKKRGATRGHTGHGRKIPENLGRKGEDNRSTGREEILLLLWEAIYRDRIGRGLISRLCLRRYII